MATNKQINAILSLKDRMSAPLVKVADNMDGVSQQSKKAAAGFNKMGRKFEKTVDKGIKSTMKWAKRLAILGAGTSIKLGIEGLKEIEYGAAKVDTIARGALNVKEVQKDIIRMSNQIGGGITPGEVADAQYSAISSGIAPKDSLDFTEVAGKLSVAGFTDIDSSIRLLTSMMNAFDLQGVNNAISLADQLLYTQNKGVILVDEMAHLYGALVPFFASMNLGVEDMNVAIATTTKMGMPAAQAVTAIRSAVTSIIKPSEDAADYAKSIGINLSASALEAKGFGGMMADIIRETGGEVDNIVRIFPNARALLAGLNLSSDQGIAIFQDILEGYGDSEGLLEEAFEKMQNTIPYRMDSIKQNLKNLNTEFYMGDRFQNPLLESLIELDEYLKSDEGREKAFEFFEKLYGVLDKLFNIVKKLIDFILNNSEALVKVLQAIISVWAAMKIGRAISKIGGFVKLIKDVVAAMGGGELVLGAISKIGMALFFISQAAGYIKKHIEGLRESYPELFEIFDTIKEKLSELWETMQEHGSSLGDVIGGIMEILSTALEFVVGVVIHSILTGLDILRQKIEALGDIFGGVVDVIRGIFEGDWQAVWDGIERTASGAVRYIETMWQAFIAKFTVPVEAVVDILSDKFHEKAEAIREKWRKIKTWLKNPISQTVTIVEEKVSSWRKKRKKAANSWTGRSYWRGGLTELHERGGEIYDLPQGTRIYPHDESVQMALAQGMALGGGNVPSGGSVNVSLNIHGNVYGEEDLMNKVGNNLVRVINDNLNNM